MKITKINSLDEYCLHRDRSYATYEAMHKIETRIQKQVSQENKIMVNGYSWPAKSESTFLVDNLYSHNNHINFRERFVCSKTGLNSRLRASIHIFEDYLKPQKDSSIYLTEQCSVLGKWMQDNYKNIQCSEYLAECGTIQKSLLNHYVSPYKLQHQDLTNLSFADNQFDFLLSFDCFEHIPNYKKAFQECLRVMKPGGKFLWSVPFDRDQYKTLVRAYYDKDNKLVHNCEPEYHGDPISKDGCLSYYTFGWEVLDQLLAIGFKKAYALLFWSEKYGYMGGEQILLCVEK